MADLSIFTTQYNTLNEHIGNNRGTLSDKQKANCGYFARLMYGYGWTLIMCAGVLGNARTESYLNPNIFEGSANYSITQLINKGYGFCQWSPYYGTSTYNTAEKQRRYHGVGRPTYIRWCIDNGYMDTYMSLDTQCLYLSQGQGSGNTEWVDNLRACTTVEDAVKAFYVDYERSKVNNVGTARINNGEYAWEYLYPYWNAYGSDTPLNPDNPTPDLPSQQLLYVLPLKRMPNSTKTKRRKRYLIIDKEKLSID